MVAEKLEALVAPSATLRAAQRGDVGERAVEQALVGEHVADALLDLGFKLCLAAHRTIVNSRLQRNAQGQRHTCQACPPSPIEKKMISARPMMFSKGT